MNYYCTIFLEERNVWVEFYKLTQNVLIVLNDLSVKTFFWQVLIFGTTEESYELYYVIIFLILVQMFFCCWVYYFVLLCFCWIKYFLSYITWHFIVKHHNPPSNNNNKIALSHSELLLLSPFLLHCTYFHHHFSPEIFHQLYLRLLPFKTGPI